MSDQAGEASEVTVHPDDPAAYVQLPEMSHSCAGSLELQSADESVAVPAATVWPGAVQATTDEAAASFQYPKFM